MKNYKTKRKHAWRCTPTQLILLGFLGAILTGTLLLCLPFATASGEPASLIDALFTATTSVCVTGLVVVETAGYWSLFGKIVILILIQCGGLGIISFTTAALLILRKKITLRDRVVLEEAFNLNSLSGLLRFLQKVFAGTFLIEGLGAFFSAFTFVPAYGVAKGIWYSVFHSVSSFCNAGLDVLGADSLVPFRHNFLLNIVTMFLIVSGGLGFPVWWDIVRCLKEKIKGRKTLRYSIRRLNLHSKLALIVTAGLITVGTLGIFLLEKNNPGTLQGESVSHSLLMSAFQSVTVRTAGFFTIPQQNLTEAGAFFSILLMFIGGSPIGTAGGIKTTTAAVLILTAGCLIRGRQDTSVFGRTISQNTIRKVIGIVIISVGVIAAAIMALLIFEDGSFLDLSYEVISATATVGLSRNITFSLGSMGKLIIICCMYLGRTGPISLAIALGKKKEQKGNFSYPIEEFPVG